MINNINRNLLQLEARGTVVKNSRIDNKFKVTHTHIHTFENVYLHCSVKFKKNETLASGWLQTAQAGLDLTHDKGSCRLYILEITMPHQVNRT